MHTYMQMSPYAQLPLAQTQSGAMLLYIADKHDARVKTLEDRALCAQWVLFASTDLVRTCASFTVNTTCLTLACTATALRTASRGRTMHDAGCDEGRERPQRARLPYYLSTRQRVRQHTCSNGSLRVLVTGHHAAAG